MSGITNEETAIERAENIVFTDAENMSVDHSGDLNDNVMKCMITRLQESEATKSSKRNKWKCINIEGFHRLLSSANSLNKHFFKHELQLMLFTFAEMTGLETLSVKSTTNKKWSTSYHTCLEISQF